MRTWFDRAAPSWVAGAFYSAFALSALAPLLLLVWQPSVVLIFLHWPAYMLHQAEEHRGDAFRTFVNERMFGGREALTVSDVVWINLPCVWGLELLAIYGAAVGGAGFGLVAPYLALTNSCLHIAGALRLRCYNPGLWTAIGVLTPLGLAALFVASGSLAQHAFGLGVALALHIFIGAKAVARAAALKPKG